MVAWTVQRIGRARHVAVPPAALLQDEEEDRHRRGGLQHAQPQVGARQQRPGDQRFAGRPRREPHDPAMRPFGAERQRRQHVGAEVDGEDLDHGERQRDPEEHEGEVGNQLGDVRGEDVGEELADVLEDRAPFLDRVDDAREVVVEEDHVRRLLRHVGAGDPHGDADVRGPERGGVVHAVAGDRDNVPLALEALDHEHLLLCRDAGEQDLRAVERDLQLRRRHRAQRLAAHDGRRRGPHQPDLAGDRHGGVPDSRR